jgi:hypothetical protein
MAPILALIPDLGRWRPGEKRALVRIIRAKGGKSEAAYVRLLRGHVRLARSLHALADSAPAAASPTPSSVAS